MPMANSRAQGLFSRSLFSRAENSRKKASSTRSVRRGEFFTKPQGPALPPLRFKLTPTVARQDSSTLLKHSALRYLCAMAHPIGGITRPTNVS
jgi:hypothetical protein